MPYPNVQNMNNCLRLSFPTTFACVLKDGFQKYGHIQYGEYHGHHLWELIPSLIIIDCSQANGHSPHCSSEGSKAPTVYTVLA